MSIPMGDSYAETRDLDTVAILQCSMTLQLVKKPQISYRMTIGFNFRLQADIHYVTMY